MLKAKLSRNYISVDHDGRPSYGGSQDWFKGMLGICGCSVIGAGDLLWYLENVKDRPSGNDGNTAQQADDDLPVRADATCLSDEEYRAHILRIRKSFFLIPFRGIPGFLTAPLLSIYMMRNRLPYRVYWGAGRAGIRKTAAAMLKHDIPVPVCIGNCVHQFFHKPLYHGLRFYEKRQTGENAEPSQEGKEQAQGKTEYIWVKTVRNHMVVLTGIRGKWGRVSSWGREYYIDLRELEDLSKKDAFGFFTNIIRIRRA